MYFSSHSEIKFNCQYPAHQDVKLTASNDDYYFVFEDFLYQVSFTNKVCGWLSYV